MSIDEALDGLLGLLDRSWLSRGGGRLTIAVSCLGCDKVSGLKWMCDGEDVWWVACEICGRISPPGVDQCEAGEIWNNMNGVDIILRVG